MQYFVLAVVLFAGVLGLPDQYSTEHDKVDVEKILEDPKAHKALLDCLYAENPCVTPIGEQFKKDFPDAVATACSKCSEPQKKNLKRLLEGTKEKYPEQYETLKNKVDPENKYFDALLAALA